MGLPGLGRQKHRWPWGEARKAELPEGSMLVQLFFFFSFADLYFFYFLFIFFTFLGLHFFVNFFCAAK